MFEDKAQASSQMIVRVTSNDTLCNDLDTYQVLPSVETYLTTLRVTKKEVFVINFIVYISS